MIKRFIGSIIIIPEIKILDITSLLVEKEVIIGRVRNFLTVIERK